MKRAAALQPQLRDPGLMTPKERLRELAAILATAYARWRQIPLAGSPMNEPSCDRPRAPGAARARRGQTQREERTP